MAKSKKNVLIKPLKNKTSISKVKTIRRNYDEIKDWSMDPKGYFLIKIDRRKKVIALAHCKRLGYVNLIIEGKKPQDIYYVVHKRGLVSRFDHASYLGKELEKAYLALKYKLDYVQDSLLEL